MSQTGTNPAPGGSNAGGRNLNYPMLVVGIKMFHCNDGVTNQVEELGTGGRAAPTSNFSSKTFIHRAPCHTPMSLLR